MEDNNSKNVIASLLNQSIEDLYTTIGFELIGQSAVERDKASVQELGKKYVALKRNDIKTLICQNEQVKVLLSNEQTTQNRINLALAILDLIASYFIGISPVTISVLIVKEGIGSFCH